MSKRIEGVEIFAVGTFIPSVPAVPMKFTREDLDAIVANTRSLGDRAKLPIKLGHSTHQVLKGQSDGDPQFGRMRNLRVQGDKILADFEDIPEPLFKAISQGLWRNVSVEMHFADGLGWVIDGVALLGADLPAIETLNDLMDLVAAQTRAGNPGEVRAAQFSIATPSITSGDKTVSDKVEITKAEHEELQQLRQFKQKREAEALVPKADFEKVKSDLEAAQKRERDRHFAEAKAEALKPIEAAVKAGKMTPAVRDEIAAAFDAQSANFTQGAKLTLPVELAAKFASAKLPEGETAEGNPDGEKDGGDSRIDVQLSQRVQAELDKNPKLDAREARDRVFRADPVFAKAWQDERLNFAAGRA